MTILIRLFFLTFAICINSLVSVHAEGVKPSATQKLKPGQVLADYRRLQLEPRYSIQRLTDRTYVAVFQVYNVLFYVGDKGVFILDPAGPDQALIALEAIAEITDLPVTAMMYSHSHQDHIAGAKAIAEAAEKAGVKLRIIATDKTNADLTRYPTVRYGGAGIPEFVMPKPTEVLSTPYDEFSFEALKVEVHTPEHWIHSWDSSIIYMPTEKIVTLVDIIEHNDLPLWSFGDFKDIKSYRDSMKKVLEMDVDFVNGGHFNIGSKETIEFYLDYLDDVEIAVDKAITKAGHFKDYYDINTPIAQSVNDHFGAVAVEARKNLQPKYGHLKSFEALVDSHSMMVIKERGTRDGFYVPPKRD